MSTSKVSKRLWFHRDKRIIATPSEKDMRFNQYCLEYVYDSQVVYIILYAYSALGQRISFFAVLEIQLPIHCAYMRVVTYTAVRNQIIFFSRRDLEQGKSYADVCKEKLAVWVKRFQAQSKNDQATLNVNDVQSQKAKS